MELSVSHCTVYSLAGMWVKLGFLGDFTWMHFYSWFFAQLLSKLAGYWKIVNNEFGIHSMNICRSGSTQPWNLEKPRQIVYLVHIYISIYISLYCLIQFARLIGTKKPFRPTFLSYLQLLKVILHWQWIFRYFRFLWCWIASIGIWSLVSIVLIKLLILMLACRSDAAFYSIPAASM